MLTVACVWMKSDLYDSQIWVERLYHMVDRWIGIVHRPYRFVCITDQAFKLWGENIGNIELMKPFHRPSFAYNKPEKKWWYKLNMFELEAEKVLYFDLDVVLMGHLGELIDFPSDFVVAPSSGVPMRNNDFNSSVVMFRPDSEQAKFVRAHWPESVPYHKFAGDQQWLSSLKMRVDLFPSRWIHKYLPGKGPYLPPDGTKVALMIQGGKNKVLSEAGHDWIKEFWR